MDFEACRDKFLVQSVKLSEEEAGHPISPNLFSKSGGKDVHEFKLKVSYTSSSLPSPVREMTSSAGPKGDAADKDAAPSASANGVAKEIKSHISISSDVSGSSVLKKDALGGGSASVTKRKSADRTGEGAIHAGLPLKKQMTLKGFSLLHLFVAALLAFFIGRFTS